MIQILKNQKKKIKYIYDIFECLIIDLLFIPRYIINFFFGFFMDIKEYEKTIITFLRLQEQQY
jgi:hypothetical protein